MNVAFKRRNLIIWACLAAAVGGLDCLASPVDVQNADAPAISRSVSITDSRTQTADRTADEQLSTRVKAALHADPYFYDKHVTVSVKRGAVVLGGFVFSDWDLRNALRIARRAAGDSPVIDNLSIKEGGQR
jgi:osmotically-inducible protein OsmY